MGNTKSPLLLGTDWAARCIHEDVLGHLNGSAVGSGFRAPAPDNARGVIKRNFGTDGNTLAESHYGTSNISAHRSNPRPQGLPHCRTRLPWVGNPHTIWVRGTTGDQQAKGGNGESKWNVASGFHGWFLALLS